MAYDKVNWIDNVTDLSAENFGKMDEGIYQNSLEIDRLKNQVQDLSQDKQKKLKAGLGILLQDDGTISVEINPTPGPTPTPGISRFYSNKISLIMKEQCTFKISNLQFGKAVIVEDNLVEQAYEATTNYTEDIIAKRVDIYGYDFEINGPLVVPVNSLDGKNLLEELDLDDSGIKVLGPYALSNCGTSFKKSNLPDSLTKIAEYSLANNDNFQIVKIPDGVTELGDYCFSGCSGLVNIEIPLSVTKIGVEILDGCSAMKTVFYEGTPTQWDAIDKDASNFNHMSSWDDSIIFYNFSSNNTGSIAIADRDPENMNIGQTPKVFPTRCRWGEKIYDLVYNTSTNEYVYSCLTD